MTDDERLAKRDEQLERYQAMIEELKDALIREAKVVHDLTELVCNSQTVVTQFRETLSVLQPLVKALVDEIGKKAALDEGVKKAFLDELIKPCLLEVREQARKQELFDKWANELPEELIKKWVEKMPGTVGRTTGSQEQPRAE
jgi:hypothetical protein